MKIETAETKYPEWVKVMRESIQTAYEANKGKQPSIEMENEILRNILTVAQPFEIDHPVKPVASSIAQVMKGVS